MIPHAEQWLAALLLALYLKDCLLLLRPDEAVLRLGLRGRWRVGLGLRDWTLRGREPYLCHPLRPFEPVWRLPWLNAAVHAEAAPAGRTGGPDVIAVPPGLLALRPWVAGIWLSLFVALPACVILHLPLALTLGVLALLYAQIGVALVLAWRVRAALGMAGGRLAALAAEVLVCPPYAANLLRKLSLGLAHGDDLAGASARLMDGPAWAALNERCRARLASRIAQFDAADPQVAALGPLRRHFGVDGRGAGHDDD